MKISDLAIFTTETGTLYIERSKVVAVFQSNRPPDATPVKIHRCKIWLDGQDLAYHVCEDIDAVFAKLA